MSEVWHAKGAGHAVVWRLWLRDIPYAEEALVLVRGICPLLGRIATPLSL